VAHRLGNVTSAGKIFFGQRRVPVRRSVLPAMLACAWIVVLDFEIITARFFEIDRISKMRLMRRGYAFDLVLGFMIRDICGALEFPWRSRRENRNGWCAACSWNPARLRESPDATPYLDA